MWQGNQKNPDELLHECYLLPSLLLLLQLLLLQFCTAATAMQKRKENKVIFEVNCVTQEMANVILINTSIFLIPAKTSRRKTERRRKNVSNGEKTEVDEVEKDADI